MAIHYLSIKNPIVFGLGGQRVRCGRAQIIINSITVGVNGGAGGSYIDVDVVIHTTTHRTSSLTPYKVTTNAALVWVDTTSTTATVLASSGVVVHSMRCPTGGNITESKRFTLEPGESISYIVTGSGTPKVRIGVAGYEIR